MHVQRVLITSDGVDGDHSERRKSKRQVTLIGKNHLAEMAAIVGFQGDVHLASRRNIMIEQLPDGDLKGKTFKLGDKVVLEIISYCTPCERMNENFGEGAIEALDGRAGWIAKVITEGKIEVGDPFIAG